MEPLSGPVFFIMYSATKTFSRPLSDLTLLGRPYVWTPFKKHAKTAGVDILISFDQLISFPQRTLLCDQIDPTSLGRRSSCYLPYLFLCCNTFCACKKCAQKEPIKRAHEKSA